MLGPPSTLAGQKRGGYLLVAAAVVLTIVFTVFAVADSAPWTRLLAVYLVTGVLAAAGLRQVIAARRGRLQFDDRRRQATYRAGHHAFWILVLAIGTDSTFGLTDGDATALYLLTSMATFLAALVYFESRIDDR